MSVETPKPGIHFDVPFDVYQSWPALNPSLAKTAKDSLKEYAYRRLQKNEPTEAMQLGTATHTSILEPDSFHERYAVAGQCEAKKKDGVRCENIGIYRQAEKWFCGVRGHLVGDQDAIDRIALSQDDYDATVAMRHAVHTHAKAGPLVCDRMASREVSLVWIDEVTGILCKGRVDILGTGWIADLKKISKLTRFKITQHCATYGYHISMAAYQDGLRILSGKVADLKLVFVCSDAPHDTAVVNVKDAALECGRRKWRELVDKIVAADAVPYYPGIAEDEEIDLVLPDYELSDVEDELDLDFTK